MEPFTLPVRPGISLTNFVPADVDALVRYLASPEIYRWTLQIPHPYTEQHAEQWLEIVRATTQMHGRPIQWAVRDEDDQLIGGFGLQDLHADHRAEIGYWLATPYWGQGIMSDVVRVGSRHAMATWNLARIAAYVFADNTASARVLTKCGFVEEGTLRNYHRKDGLLVDSRLFARCGNDDDAD